MRALHRVLLPLVLAACTGPAKGGADGQDGADGGDGTDGLDGTDGADGLDSSAVGERPISVTVTLDGEPTAGVVVYQAGTRRLGITDAAGQTELVVDYGLDAEIVLTASHPDARIGGFDLSFGEAPDEALIELLRFDRSDNEAYIFQHPGSREERPNTGYCAHCHLTLNDDWLASPHARAASNPWLQDLYAGTAHGLASRAACEAAGGRWRTGIAPGTGASADRCYIGEGVLPDLNDCGDSAPCDTESASLAQRGACADCHAPGIDGVLGGRDLLEARDIAYDAGVHCDVCHKVESVDLEATDPGVAGRLRVLRPAEDRPVAGLEWTPLTFGPYPDVLNPRMGSVQRDHFQDSTICAGCHEHWQPVLVSGVAVDTDRWPDGLLPVHTTWSELGEGALGETGVACVSCHMPPAPDVGNSADLGNELDPHDAGIAGGWPRPPGAVRRHAWFGPRSGEQRMIDLAAQLQLSLRRDGADLVAELTTRNVGPGHAIPTGEPLRSLLVQLRATCEDEPLEPIGGDALPAWAGALDQQEAGADWARWPGAAVGDRIRVVGLDGRFHDYIGPGPFGDGRFDPAARGLPVEEVLGGATVLAVSGDLVSLDGPLPDGSRAYRLPADEGLVQDGDPVRPLAGDPGFAFARVMVGPDGAEMVPHFLAVDVRSDNRLMPGQSFTSLHRFSGDCASPVVEARLIHRPAPWALSQQRAWQTEDAVMASVSEELTP